MTTLGTGGGHDLEEVEATARSLAKRLRALADVANGRNAARPFVKGTREAAELLDAALVALKRPDSPVPTLRRPELGGANTPGSVARHMGNGALPVPDAPAPPAPPAGGEFRDLAPAVVLNGRCAFVGFSELLEFLGSLRKSGILWVKSPAETITIQLQDGFVVHASTNNSPRDERLGNVLVLQGAIEAHRLEAFLARHSRWNGKLGVALERDELVSPDQLVRALEYQIQKLFERLAHSPPEATFTFNEQPGMVAADNRVRMSVVQLLLESLERKDRAGS